MKQTNERLCALAQKGDAAALDSLIENNKSFIGKVANDLFRSMNLAQSGLNLDTNDLKQAGNLGLWKAVPKFDAARGMKFLTYAAPAIRNAMTLLVAALTTRNSPGAYCSSTIRMAKVSFSACSFRNAICHSSSFMPAGFCILFIFGITTLARLRRPFVFLAPWAVAFPRLLPPPFSGLEASTGDCSSFLSIGTFFMVLMMF